MNIFTKYTNNKGGYIEYDSSGLKDPIIWKTSSPLLTIQISKTNPLTTWSLLANIHEEEEVCEIDELCTEQKVNKIIHNDKPLYSIAIRIDTLAVGDILRVALVWGQNPFY